MNELVLLDNGNYCKKYYDGTVMWFDRDVRFHRGDDQPAIIQPDGTQAWYINGLLHRESDQPAVIYHNGRQEWWKNGTRHRDDGPAICNGSYEEYWRFGKLHRLGGPAIISGFGEGKWYINGKFSSKTEQENMMLVAPLIKNFRFFSV